MTAPTACLLETLMKTALVFLFLSAAVGGAQPGRFNMAEAQLLAGAPQRISRYRKSALTIRVVDDRGQPVRQARVKVEQLRHAFLFGCNVFLLNRLETPELEREYRKRFAALFNYATLPFYWAGFEKHRGEPEYERLERMADWCREQGITCKGHPLVWNHPAGVPRWLPADPAEVKQLSDERVRAVVSHFRGKIDFWDVVNEAADPYRPGFENRMTAMLHRFGKMPVTVGSFEIARQANPGATLLINDYRLDHEYERVIDGLVGPDGKRLYDVIGIQSHMHAGPWPLGRLWEVCQQFARYGVPLHFTETTIVSGPRTPTGWNTTREGERRQAEAVVKFYTLLFSHPAVEAITWWDLSDRHAWQQAPAGLVREDMSPKPAYQQLVDRVKRKWWTNVTKNVGETGAAAMRVFQGQHRITVETPLGKTATRTVTVGKKDTEVVITIK